MQALGQFLWPPVQASSERDPRQMSSSDSDNEDAQIAEQLVIPYPQQADNRYNFTSSGSPSGYTVTTETTQLPTISLNNVPLYSSTPQIYPGPRPPADYSENSSPSFMLFDANSPQSPAINSNIPSGSQPRVGRPRARTVSPRGSKRNSPQPSPERAPSKVRLISVPDLQQETLTEDLRNHLYSINQLLSKFAEDLQALRKETVAATRLAESAEKRAMAAELALKNERTAAEQRLTKLQADIQEQSAKQIHDAERRAEATLRKLKMAEQSPENHTHEMSVDTDLDQMPTSQSEKGKQRAESSGSTMQPSAPQIPPPPRFPPPVNTAPIADQSALPSTVPKPVSFKRPKSSSKPIKIPSLNRAPLHADDSDQDANSSDSEEEPEASERKQSSNISNLNGEDVLRLLLKSVGIDVGIDRSRRGRRVHPDFKQPAKIMPKKRGRQDLMNWLRSHLHLLLNITRSRDILNSAGEIYSSNTPIQRQMILWEEKREGDGPQLKPMQINWNNLDGPWNTHLCELFVQHCAKEGLEEGNPSDDVRLMVAEYFWDRLVRLRGILKKNRPKSDETAQQTSARTHEQHVYGLSTARRNSRRNQKYQDRLDICLENLPDNAGAVMTEEQGEWKRRYDAVSTLGPEGVSSDETDDTTPNSYWVRKLSWRNQKLTSVMSSIDGAKNITNGYGNVRPGNRPRNRQRRRNAAESSRKVPTGKPRNFYEPEWYEMLNAMKKKSLGAKSDVMFEQ